METVQSVKDLNVEDPVYYTFEDTEETYKGDTLVIEEQNLNNTIDKTDGMMTFNVTGLVFSQLVCTPPKHQPEATNENGAWN